MQPVCSLLFTLPLPSRSPLPMAETHVLCGPCLPSPFPAPQFATTLHSPSCTQTTTTCRINTSSHSCHHHCMVLLECLCNHVSLRCRQWFLESPSRKITRPCSSS